MADGSILIDTKIDESGIKEGLSSLTSKVKAGALVISAALAAGTAAVVKFGSEFESSMAKSSTLFGEANVNMNQLNTDMLKLSDTTGVAASQLGNTLYNALSAGIPATDNMAESLGFLEKNAKLAKAGFTDVDTATTATAKVLNAYKMDVSETDKVHKILMQTQNKGITTVGELGSVLAQVTPTAAAMNVKFEQVGAALANMTAQGTPTAQATTQLNQLFAELGKKGTQAQKGLAEATKGTQYAGMSFQDLMAKGVPLNEILDLMDTYAKKNKKSMIDMFGSLEAGKAALANAGQNSAAFTQNLKAMSTETDVVGEAYDKVMDTFEEQSKKALNSLKNLGIGIYNNIKEPLKDSVKNASKGLDELSRSFNSGKLKRSISDLGDQMGKTASSLLDFAIKAIPKVIDGLSWLMKNGKTIINVIIALKTAQVAYNAAMVAAKVIGSVTQLIQFGAGVMKSLTTATSLATIATTAFNGTMTATQGIVALATGGITILLGALAMWGVNAMMSKDANDELSDSINEQKKAWDELREASQQRSAEAVLEIDLAAKYNEELKSLVDKEGNIIGNKERVKFLIAEINKLMPDAITLTEEQKVQYNESAEALDKLIQKKRAEALIEAYKDEYIQALKNEKDLANQIYDQEQKVKEQKEKVVELQNRYNAERNAWAQGQMDDKIKKETNALWEMEQGLSNLETQHVESFDTIARVTKANTAIANEEYDKVEGHLRGYSDSIEATAVKSSDSWEQHKTDTARKMAELEIIIKNGGASRGEEWVKQQESELKSMRDYWDQIKDMSFEEAANSVGLTMSGYNSKQADLQKTISGIFVSSLDGATNDPKVLRSAVNSGIDNISKISISSYNSRGDYEKAVEKALYESLINAGIDSNVAAERAKLGAKNIADVAQASANNTDTYSAALKSVLLTSLQNSKVSPEVANKAVELAQKNINNISDETKKNPQEYEKAVEKAIYDGLVGAGVDPSVARQRALLGSSIAPGVLKGIASNQDSVSRKLISYAGGWLGAALRALGINSPSKVFRDRVGIGIMEGVAVGIDKGYSDTRKTIVKSMENLTTEAQKEMARAQYQWTHPIKMQANYKAKFGRPQWVQNNNDNGVTQNVYLQTETNSPAEAARKLRHAAQMIAYQK